MDFESKFYITNNMIKKYVYRVVCFKIRLICFMLVIISLGLMLISYSNEFYLFVLVCCFSFLLVLIFLIYPLSVYKNIINIKSRIHSNKDYEALVSFSNDIRLVEGEQKITVDYKMINRIYEVDDIIVLMFTSQCGIIVSLDGLVIGDKKGFYKYILRKCSKVKNVIKR